MGIVDFEGKILQTVSSRGKISARLRIFRVFSKNIDFCAKMSDFWCKIELFKQKIAFFDKKIGEPDRPGSPIVLESKPSFHRAI